MRVTGSTMEITSSFKTRWDIIKSGALIKFKSQHLFPNIMTTNGGKRKKDQKCLYLDKNLDRTRNHLHDGVILCRFWDFKAPWGFPASSLQPPKGEDVLERFMIRFFYILNRQPKNNDVAERAVKFASTSGELSRTTLSGTPTWCRELRLTVERTQKPLSPRSLPNQSNQNNQFTS